MRTAPVEAMALNLNIRDIVDLQSELGYPLVSVFVSVSDDDAVHERAAALIGQAEQRLAQELSPNETGEIVDRLTDQALLIDPSWSGGAVALFASPTGGKGFRLPYAVDEEVVIDDTFATRNLIHALQRMPRYLVAALSSTGIRLFTVAGAELVEHAAHADLVGLPHTSDTLPDAFARAVDEVLELHLAQDPQPLMLLAPEPLLTAFMRVSAVRHYVVGSVAGDFGVSSPGRILRAVMPQIARQRLERERGVLDRLVAARSSARVAAGIHDVWDAAHHGTITLLAVEERYRYPATVQPDGGLAGQHDPTPPGVLDDAVDEVIEIALRHDAEVRFVADDHLAEWGGIAAITRGVSTTAVAV